MDGGEVVFVTVSDEENGDVIFEGKVSTDVSPGELVRLRCFRERNLTALRIKATKKLLMGFKGLHSNVELLASGGDVLDVTGVLYTLNGVLRSSKRVLPSGCKSMLLWKMPFDEKVFQCEALEDLEVFSCHGLPSDDIGRLKNLKQLRLFGLNELQSVPEGIGQLVNLIELHIDWCGVVSLPKSIGGLKQLQKMQLQLLRELKSVPEEMGDLSNLKELWIEDCGVVSLPESMARLNCLEKLTLWRLMDMKHTPEWIAHLVNLKELSIGYCAFESLPKHLQRLTSIKLESMDNLQLHPEDLVSFSKMKRVSIQRCDDAFSVPSWTHAFWEMIKSTVCIRHLELDWFISNQDALEENGSIVDGGGPFVERNQCNHEGAMLCVVRLMAIRRWRNALNDFPKEMVKMIAMMLWNTKCDVGAWSKKEN